MRDAPRAHKCSATRLGQDRGEQARRLIAAHLPSGGGERRPGQGQAMNLDTVTDTDIADAAAMDDLAGACRLAERAAGIAEGSFVAGRFPEMSTGLAVVWAAFYDPVDRAESIRHWLVIERLWP